MSGGDGWVPKVGDRVRNDDYPKEAVGIVVELLPTCRVEWPNGAGLGLYPASELTPVEMDPVDELLLVIEGLVLPFLSPTEDPTTFVRISEAVTAVKQARK